MSTFKIVSEEPEISEADWAEFEAALLHMDFADTVKEDRLEACTAFDDLRAID